MIWQNHTLTGSTEADAPLSGLTLLVGEAGVWGAWGLAHRQGAAGALDTRQRGQTVIGEPGGSQLEHDVYSWYVLLIVCTFEQMHCLEGNTFTSLSLIICLVTEHMKIQPEYK